MPHADTSIVPTSIQTKPEFWVHVHAQLHNLLADGQRDWITNLANASSLIFNSLLAFRIPSDTVNWCGFYIDSALYPLPRYSDSHNTPDASNHNRLLLGPFCGKPACQYISVAPDKSRGVCADAYLQRKTLIVKDVDQYPGHIACDDQTRSEIVLPLIYGVDSDKTVVLGVLDLDCLAIDGFDEEDREGLEKIAKLIVNSCNW